MLSMLTSQYCKADITILYYKLSSFLSLSLIDAILKMKLRNKNKQKPTTEPKEELSLRTESILKVLRFKLYGLAFYLKMES